MATINKDKGLLVNNNRVFLRSDNINVFPCSRRGQNITQDTVKYYYDPEARLNTERTNRLHTAVNGFKDSFIYSYINKTLAFVLAGYHIEAKNFDPAVITSVLGSDTTTIYAHLHLHDSVSLGVEDYFTEMLGRQSDSENDKNYLDVTYEDGTNSDDFFVGVSFTKEPIVSDTTTMYNLPLFSYIGEEWVLVQTSLLPKIEHGETDDSVKISGDFTVKHGERTSFKVTGNETVLGPTEVSKLTVTEDTTLEKGLVVASGDTSVQKLLVNSDLVVNGSTVTPTLKTNKITSDSDVITVDKKLTLSTNTSITAPVANVHSTLNVTNSAKNAIADVDELVADKATIGDLIVKADSGLNNSTGNITTLNFQATNNATIYDLDVGTNIDTSTLKATTSIAAPQLNTNNITSDNTEIVVDKVLKVDTINTEKLVVTKIVEETNEITGETIQVDKGEVVTPTLRVNRLTTNSGSILVDDKKLTVTKSLEVLAKKAIDEEDRGEAATATIDKAVIGELTVTAEDDDLTGSTGKVEAKEVVAEKITQNGNQVPVIALEQVSAKGILPEIWQLQIVNVIKKPKN